MNDHGLQAHVKASLRTFIAFSRRSGRTTAMIDAARNGDLIITASEQEARRIRRLLQDAGKEVTVGISDPARDPMMRRGTNPTGATIFDHSWLELYWETQIDRAAANLFNIKQAMSKQQEPEPEQRLSDRACNIIDWSLRG